MKTREEYHIDSQLAEVRVELPRERKTDAITPDMTADKGLASLMRACKCHREKREE